MEIADVIRAFRKYYEQVSEHGPRNLYKAYKRSSPRKEGIWDSLRNKYVLHGAWRNMSVVSYNGFVFSVGMVSEDKKRFRYITAYDDWTMDLAKPIAFAGNVEDYIYHGKAELRTHCHRS